MPYVKLFDIIRHKACQGGRLLRHMAGVALLCTLALGSVFHLAHAGSNYGDFAENVPDTAHSLIVAGDVFLVY